MRISQISPYLLGAIVGISWIGIAYIAFPSEEKMRIKAEEIMNQQQSKSQFKSADAEQPEEYRQEYIDRQKRKFKKAIESKKKEDEENRILYQDYQKFASKNDSKNEQQKD